MTAPAGACLRKRECVATRRPRAGPASCRSRAPVQALVVQTAVAETERIQPVTAGLEYLAASAQVPRAWASLASQVLDAVPGARISVNCRYSHAMGMRLLAAGLRPYWARSRAVMAGPSCSIQASALGKRSFPASWRTNERSRRAEGVHRDRRPGASAPRAHGRRHPPETARRSASGSGHRTAHGSSRTRWRRRGGTL